MYTFVHFVFSTFIHTHTYILTFLSLDLIYVLMNERTFIIVIVKDIFI